MKSDTPPAGCLDSLISMFFSRQQDQNAGGIPKVQINKKFISDAEANFFRVLTLLFHAF